MPLYLHAFTHAPYQNQYLNYREELEWLKNLFKVHQAQCYFAFHTDQLVAFMLIAPTSYDQKMPAVVFETYPLSKCLSIAEIAVCPEYRGQGIAGTLLKTLIHSKTAQSFEYLVARTNQNAQAAKKLYSAHGFKEVLRFDALVPFRVKNSLENRLIPKCCFVYHTHDAAPAKMITSLAIQNLDVG